MTDRQLRVAVVTHYFPSAADPSAGQSAYQTLRRLARLCDVHVFVPVMNYPRLFAPPGHKRLEDGNWSAPGVKATYIRYPIFPIISRPLNGYMIGKKLLPYVRRFRPDIILSYVIYSNGFAAVQIAEALDIPVIITAIGSDLNSIPDPLLGMLTRSALRRANHVSTVSHALCAKAIELGADPARTSAKLNGCDTSVFRPMDRGEARQALGLDPDAEIILYVGRLDHRKGLVELVEAVALLGARRPNLRCYVIGDGRDKPMLLEAIRRHGADRWLTIVPTSPSEKVAVWMAAANLVTLPSYMEGCPNVVIEALASGRPVVSTNVGGIPELMDETVGRLVPPRDVSALLRGLDEVLAQHWDVDAISSKHSRSWGHVAVELAEQFEETVVAYHANKPQPVSQPV